MSQSKSTNQVTVFGQLQNGEAVEAHTLINKNGIEVTIITFGATITSIKIPLQNGKKIDVVLGFDNLADYVKSFEFGDSPYFGATVGRYAGRIKNGVFQLNNKTYQLDQNFNNHTLHGGKKGISQKIWKVKDDSPVEKSAVTFSCFSPTNEGDFPGDLAIELTYTLTDENELLLDYSATSSEDTIINLTNHSYFNLEGHTASISNQDLIVNSIFHLETDSENIPTGNFFPNENTPFDYSKKQKCPTTIDTSFVMNKDQQIAASLYSEKTKLKMSVYTNQPSVHIYVGGTCNKYLRGKENTVYHDQSGICFEAQNFPDAPNHPSFPSAILKRGATYLQKTSYKFEI